MATIASLFVGGVGALKISGIRAGPLRALMLAFNSKFFRKVRVKSCRVNFVANLQKQLATLPESKYIVVEGDKGVGKSCAISSALIGAKGVVDVTIPGGTTQQRVTDMCSAAIVGGVSLSFINQKSNVERVVKWYCRIFRGGPSLVMTMSERNSGMPYAEVTGAIRALADMGVKVIVDASPNSLPAEATATKRQLVLHVEELTPEEVRSLPQLADTFKRLDKVGLSALVLRLLGGNPAEFERLAMTLDMLAAPSTDDEIRTAVEMFCGDMVSQVTKHYLAMTTHRADKLFGEIFALFKTNDTLPTTALQERELELPSPCKILRTRKVDGMGKDVLMASSPVAAFFFQHSCDDDATLEALHSLIWASSTGTPPQ